MSRIGTDHLAREAIVYVRQSTVGQVINNVESRRRQYGLVERARQLGWANVSVIADDLGRSVIPPFLVGRISRIYAAIFSFWAGVMPPMPMLGRSL